MSIQNFPLEVLLIVLSNVKSSRDIISCAQVCRSWCEPACRFLYEEISFERIRNSLPLHAKHIKTMGKFCKILNFIDIGREEGPFEHYDILLSSLPNVQKIVLGDYPSRQLHLRQLALNAKFFKQLKNISTVEEESWKGDEIQLFVDLAIKFKETLEVMDLASLGCPVSVDEGRAEDVLTLLPAFSSLTELKVFNWDPKFEEEEASDMSMFSILRSCPNLIDFSSSNYFMEREDRDNDQPFDHSKLRRLDICVPQFTKQQITYLYSNITQLDELELRTCYSNSEETAAPAKWMKRIGLDNRFHNYLANINKVEFTITDQFDATISEQFAFIDGILKNNPSLTAHISLVIYPFEREVVCQSSGMTKDGDNVFFRCGILANEWLTTIDEFPTLIPNTMSNYNITAMEINAISDNPDDDRLFMTHLMYIFETFFKPYGNLESINIVIRLSNQIKFRIKMKKSNKPKDPKSNILADKLPLTYATPLSLFDYLLIKNSQEPYDIYSILRLVPNTRYLHLLGCKFKRYGYNNFSLDLVDKNLELLVLEIPLKAPRFEIEATDRPIFLQIEEDYAKKTSYYQWIKRKGEFDSMKFQVVNPSPLIESLQYDYTVSFFRIKCFKIERLSICSSEGIIYTTIEHGQECI